jgi:hypothetical protein
VPNTGDAERRRRSLAAQGDRPPRSSWLSIAAIVVVVLAAVFSMYDPDGRSAERRRSDLASSQVNSSRVTVVVALGGRTVAVPRSFLGFSTEYWTLPVDERRVALYDRVISLLHVRGDGRFVLRIGGVSSDHVLWGRPWHRPSSWAYALTSRWMTNTARVVRRGRLRVILDLNLVTATPALDASLVRVAEARFPRGSIIAFEIGNEPDVYNRQVWSFRLGDDRYPIGRLPRAITAGTYANSLAADRLALAAVAPRTAMQGPALANPRRNRSWIDALLAGSHPRVDAISVHEYPYTACVRHTAADYPTIPGLLSDHATTAMAAAVSPAISLAHRVALPVRVSEFNSVTCGGVPGISNSFATALWAPSALFTLIRAGASAADLHVRAFSANAPFGFSRRGLVPHPLLYGLMLFTRMLGPASRLLSVRVHSPDRVRLRAWAVRQQRRLSVLLINTSAPSAKVTLELPSRRKATVQRMLAPSAYGHAGETLGGQQLGNDARWSGRKRVEIISPRKGHYFATVGGMSAAIITLLLNRSDEGKRTGMGSLNARSMAGEHQQAIRLS